MWSLIVPARNEERCISQCLEAICGLNFDLARVEIVLADNGSTDATVAHALAYAGRLQIRVISAPGLPVGALRNAAVAQAKGEYLGFLDADCLVPPGWLADADAVLAQSPRAIVGSFYALPADAGWPARLWARFFEEHKNGTVPFLPAGNFLMSRTTFERAGGFDPKLRSNEDSQFCARARAAGIDILCFPELASIHLGAERDLRHFIRRQLWHGSNVVNRFGLRANRRAIGLAAYTLLLAVLTLAAALLRAPLVCGVFLLLLFLPCAALSLVKTWRARRLANLLPLAFLLFTYAATRAFVLPLALWRGLEENS